SLCSADWSKSLPPRGLGRLFAGVARSIEADVFVPQVRMLADEALHHGDAAFIVHEAQLDAFLLEPVLASLKGAVLTDDDAADAVEDGGAAAHCAGAEGGAEGQAGPVAPSSGVADADGLRVGCGVAGLDAKVVAGGDHAACLIDECR